MSISSMRMNDISAKYKVSYSVLNKIKQKSFDEIVQNNSRKINRISRTRKTIIIDLIKYYIIIKLTCDFLTGNYRVCKSWIRFRFLLELYQKNNENVGKA